MNRGRDEQVSAGSLHGSYLLFLCSLPKTKTLSSMLMFCVVGGGGDVGWLQEETWATREGYKAIRQHTHMFFEHAKVAVDSRC